MTDLLNFLNRYSTPANLMSEPGPDEGQLEKILETAMCAPDHGRINPYRFISIRDGAREELSHVFGKACQRRDPDVT